MGNEKICENESEEITVSVVMPVYNGEKYLNQAMHSGDLPAYRQRQNPPRRSSAWTAGSPRGG